MMKTCLGTTIYVTVFMTRTIIINIIMIMNSCLSTTVYHTYLIRMTEIPIFIMTMNSCLGTTIYCTNSMMMTIIQKMSITILSIMYMVISDISPFYITCSISDLCATLTPCPTMMSSAMSPMMRTNWHHTNRSHKTRGCYY